MAIDLSGLPLARDGEANPAALRRRAGARLAATEAWLDEDGEAVDRIAADHRDLAPDLDPLHADLALRRDRAADATRHEEARAAIGATLGRLAAGAAESGEPARRQSHGALARLALQEHAEAGLIDPGEAEAFAGDYDARLAAADAEKLTRTDPALVRRLLADQSMFPGLLPEQRERLSRAAEARLAAAPDDKAASTERATAIGAGSRLTAAARNRADLRRRLTAGEAGLADIDAAEAAGEIDARGAGALRQGFTAAREMAKQEAEGIRRVEARLIASGRLDPASAEDRTALDAHYLNTRKGWDEAGLAPEEVRAELADYILDAGCFPDAVRQRIGRIFRVGTPQERWEAADLIRTIEERSRGLLDQLDADDVREALGIAALEKAGWPAADAVTRYGLLVSGEAKDPAAARDRAILEQASNSGGRVVLAPILVTDEEEKPELSEQANGSGSTSASPAPATPLPNSVLGPSSVAASSDTDLAVPPITSAPEADKGEGHHQGDDGVGSAEARPSPAAEAEHGEASAPESKRPAITVEVARQEFEARKGELSDEERTNLEAIFRTLEEGLARATPDERKVIEGYLNEKDVKVAEPVTLTVSTAVVLSALLVGYWVSTESGGDSARKLAARLGRIALRAGPGLGRFGGLRFGNPAQERAPLKERSAPLPGIGEARREKPEPPGKSNGPLPLTTLPLERRSDEEEVTAEQVLDDLLDLAFVDAWERYRKTIDPTMANPWGTRGSPLTRKDLDTLVRECKAESRKFPGMAETFKHIAGATTDGRGDQELPESTYKVRDNPKAGEKKHRRTDAVISVWNFLVDFNTVDTYKSGAIHKRELEAADDVRSLPAKILHLVEKRFSGETDASFQKRARAACNKAFREIEAKRKAEERTGGADKDDGTAREKTKPPAKPRPR